MCSDCTRHEPSVLIERASDVARIPSIVKSAVCHRIVIGKNAGKIIEHYRHTLLVRLIDNGAHPGIADVLAAASFMGAVHVFAPPQSAFFGLNRVGNHSSYGCTLRRVKAGHQEKRRRGMLSNRTEALEIAVSDRAGDLLGEKTERGQFRINRCFITTKDRAAPGVSP
jgi:hypothetical protein